MVEKFVPHEVYKDAIDIFHFDKEIRPQDRAHAYLAKHRVQRQYSDTAMQAAVLDLCARSYTKRVMYGQAVRVSNDTHATVKHKKKSWLVRLLQRLLKSLGGYDD